MASRIQGITIELNGETTKLDKALSGVNKSLKQTQNALKDVNKLLKLDPKNTDLLRQKQDLLNRAVTDTQEKLDKEKEALSQLKAADQTPEITEQMARLERQIADDEAALASFKQQQKDFGSVGAQVLKAVGQQLKEVGEKIKAVGEKIKAVGEDLSKKITAPIVAMGTASIAAFSEVDAGLDVIIKKTGASGEALDGMAETMKNLAGDVPASFEDIGAAVGEVNTRFGLTGSELEDLSGKFLKFADLNGTDVSSSIDAVQAAMAAFGVEAESAGDVLDILNKAGQNTGVSVDKLSQDLLTNSAALQEMGLGINQAVGFMSELNKSGVDQSAVMAGLKKALQNATKEGKPLSSALEDIQKRMEGAASDTEAAQIAMELFGNKAGPAIAQAVRDGRLSFDEFSMMVTDWGGSVEDTFAATQDTTDRFKTTLNELKIAGADLGAVVLDALAPALEKARGLIEDLTTKWEELSPETQEAIVQAALIAAAIGPVIVAIGTVVSSIGALIAGIGGAVSAIGTVVAVLGGPLTLAIAGAIAAGALIVANWNNIKDACSQMKEGLLSDWETIKTGVITAAENLKTGAVEKFNALKTGIQTAAENIKSTVTTKFNAVKEAITKPIEDAYSKVKNGIEKIKNTINNVKLQLPHFKLPHFRISGGVAPWGLGGQGTKPSISVDWYRRAYDNPVMFTAPTVLPTVSGLKGFGDGSGAEIVMSLNKLREVVGAGGNTYNVVINAAPGMNVEQLADAVQQRLADMQRQRSAVYA